ncbi:hypothetical protein Pelo_17101 [Pelomyxa schiedti]|nr:hypothetical protein Pelo_17101 [Pelomyxa schiedti]
MFNLGVCSENAALFQRAADAGNIRTMCCLWVCYCADKDVSKDITLFQRSDASVTRAIMCDLGRCYENAMLNLGLFDFAILRGTPCYMAPKKCSEHDDSKWGLWGFIPRHELFNNPWVHPGNDLVLGHRRMLTMYLQPPWCVGTGFETIFARDRLTLVKETLQKLRDVKQRLHKQPESAVLSWRHNKAKPSTGEVAQQALKSRPQTIGPGTLQQKLQNLQGVKEKIVKFHLNLPDFGGNYTPDFPKYQIQTDLEVSINNIPQCHCRPRGTHTIMMGSPGVGKSTLLNSIFSRDLGSPMPFPSGLSFGTGLTTTCHQKLDNDGLMLIDTPGLSEANLESMIKYISSHVISGICKPIFVVVPEAGRIRAEDKAMLSSVLQAVPMIKGNYSIIINRTPPGMFDNIPGGKDSFIAQLQGSLPSSSSVYFLPIINAWEDVDNVDAFNLLPGDFIEFIKRAPVVDFPPSTLTEDSPPTVGELVGLTYNNTIDQMRELQEEVQAARSSSNITTPAPLTTAVHSTSIP